MSNVIDVNIPKIPQSKDKKHKLVVYRFETVSCLKNFEKLPEEQHWPNQSLSYNWQFQNWGLGLSVLMQKACVINTVNGNPGKMV